MADIHIRYPLCIAAGAVFPPVASALVAMRFLARRQQSSKIGIDDWLTIPALVLVLGMCIAVLIGVAHKAVGYPTPPRQPGTSLTTTSSYQQSQTRSIYWSIELMQLPCLIAIKMSFIFFYRRIFLQSGRIFRIFTLFLLGVVGVWGIAFFFSFLFICPGHPSAYWTTLIREKTQCIDTVTLHNSYGVSDVVIDLIVLATPILPVIRLQMSNTRKLATLAVFGLGAFSIVASIIRMITYLESTAVEFKPGTDTDILITGGIYWSVVECGVGLISACLPSVYNVFKKRVARTWRNNTPDVQDSDRNTLRNDYPRTKGTQRRSSSDSQIELAGFHGDYSVQAERDTFTRHTPPKDQILVTKTLETSQQPARYDFG